MTEQITRHLLKLVGPVGGEDTTCANRLFPFLITRIPLSLQPPLCLAFWAWVCRSPLGCQGVQMARGLGLAGYGQPPANQHPGTSSPPNCLLGVQKGVFKKPSLHRVRHSSVLHGPITKVGCIRKISKNHCPQVPHGPYFQARTIKNSFTGRKKKR